MKTPKRCSDCVHIDDFLEYKEKTETRLAMLENGHSSLEDTMKELNDNLTVINKALMGDMEKDRPGMVENMRTMKSHVESLVEIHEAEAQAALNETQTVKKANFIESLPWKTITALVGVLGGLVIIIIKLLSLIPK